MSKLNTARFTASTCDLPKPICKFSDCCSAPECAALGMIQIYLLQFDPKKTDALSYIKLCLFWYFGHVFVSKNDRNRQIYSHLRHVQKNQMSSDFDPTFESNLIPRF